MGYKNFSKCVLFSSKFTKRISEYLNQLEGQKLHSCEKKKEQENTSPALLSILTNYNLESIVLF